MREKILLKSPGRPEPCVILTGMPGAGKSTVGKLLAQAVTWAYLDTDHLIEAIYARRLQEVTDAMSKEQFLDTESAVILTLRANRAIIGTGGSVVYREATMRHLKSLGTIVYLSAPLETIKERVARNPDRGLAIAPGQTMEDLFAEREALYKRWADVVCDTGSNSPQGCADELCQKLFKNGMLSAC